MRDILIKIFGTSDGNITIELFSIWHFLYLILIAGAIVGVAFWLKNKSAQFKNKTLKVISIVVLCLYIADFFLQPFVSGSPFELSIDKLPFHICTLMGIIAVFAQYSNKAWFKEIATSLAIAGALMYLTYPGSALGGVTPWCYKVVQTMVYHGLLLMWGVLTLTTGEVTLKWKNIWMPLLGLVVVALWATVGNVCYNSSYVGGDGNHHWDWFFLTGSTFTFVPTWLMPFVVIVATFGVVCCIYLIYWLATRDWKKKKAVLNETQSETLSSSEKEENASVKQEQ